MAESFAFGITDRVLGKLGSAIIQEVGLAWGVKSELEDLRDTSSAIRSLLLDAEEKQATNHQIRDWLGKLKDAFYDAEDIVDEFEYEALRRQEVARGSSTAKVRNFLSRPKSIAFNLKMGHRVNKIRERLDKIAADKSKFNLIEVVPNAPVMLSKREMTHSFVRASNVIGRDYEKENIIGLLKQSSTDSENVSVIPIVGIGGLGKTTLAKLVYNDERVVDHFSTKMWVCVSDEFDVEKLVKKILKEKKPDENYGEFSMEQLQIRLRNELDGEKFLLVLDDVRNEDREKWVKLKDLLMDSANGSKILVTTRKKSVASVMGSFPMQELKGLSKEDCLSIFVKCAFKDGEDKQYPNLLKIGEQIVQKCGGVPLAVRSLGSLLNTKKDERDWVSIRENETWKLEQDRDGIMDALRLSYYDLPHHLKQCLALFSLFRKDCEIRNRDLINGWMAQGLIQSWGQNATMEDICETYINELFSRSFLQDVEEIIPGVAYNFRMHDLVHDLAMFFAQPEYFTLSFGSKDIPKRIQHVTFSDNDWPKEEYEALRFLEKLNSSIRGIYFQMENVAPTSKSFVSACTLRFKCIRMLEFSESSFEALPNSIGSLKHLRYLGISENKKIKKLPNSICKLYHLQTLLLIGCSELEELPRGIGSMISLRTLYITTKQNDLSRKEKGLKCLNSLQHLGMFDCLNLEFLFKGMESLIALRMLQINNCPNLISLPPNIKFLTKLEILVIGECRKLEFMDGEVEGQENIQSFGSLRILVFYDLPQLVALPRWLLCGTTSNTLHQLSILDCPNIKALPETGLQKFTHLQKLEIQHCLELLERCNPEMGEDWQKIAHIPEIYLDEEKIHPIIRYGRDFKF